MLRDLNLGEMKSGGPVLAVSLALEGKASHREMTSKLKSGGDVFWAWRTVFYVAKVA